MIEFGRNIFEALKYVAPALGVILAIFISALMIRSYYRLTNDIKEITKSPGGVFFYFIIVLIILGIWFAWIEPIIFK